MVGRCRSYDLDPKHGAHVCIGAALDCGAMLCGQFDAVLL
jgi:hypothetical protein